MLEITTKQLHSFLDSDGPDIDYDTYFGNEYQGSEVLLDEPTFNALKSCDLKRIVAGIEMSENHLGGDDLVDVAWQVVEAVNQGYRIATWYGDNAEALVAGYRCQQLIVTETPPEDDGKVPESTGPARQDGVRVDASTFQEADDQVSATTYYGGGVRLTSMDGLDMTVLCRGTDRDSIGCFDEVCMVILNMLGVESSPDDFGCDEKFTQFQEAIMMQMRNQAKFDVWVEDGKLLMANDDNIGQVGTLTQED